LDIEIRVVEDVKNKIKGWITNIKENPEGEIKLFPKREFNAWFGVLSIIFKYVK